MDRELNQAATFIYIRYFRHIWKWAIDILCFRNTYKIRGDRSIIRVGRHNLRLVGGS